MTREQLVRVFPNGRTVHIPTDGQPLKNYALALADVERRGDSPSGSSLEAAQSTGVLDADKSQPEHRKRSLLAKLFGFGHADEDEDRELTSSTGRTVTSRPTAARPAVVASAEVKPDKAAPAKVAGIVPLPARRPQTTFQLASAAQPELQSRPAQAASLFTTASLSPNEIIKARGFWRGLPEAPVAPSAASRIPHQAAAPTPEASAARRQPSRDAGPATTASTTPWPVKPQNDRVSPDVALSYAAQENPRPGTGTQGASAMGTRLPTSFKTAAIPPRTTVATKATDDQPTTALTAQGLLAAAVRAHAGHNKGNDPWLRALVITPDAQRFMNTALFGMPDFRTLSPLMQKPSSAIMMTFALEPYLNLEANRFTGSAIVFIPTVTFANRTAALQ
jgi:hypothetical protein